jgi:hypothetical protein
VLRNTARRQWHHHSTENVRSILVVFP